MSPSPLKPWEQKRIGGLPPYPTPASSTATMSSPAQSLPTPATAAGSSPSPSSSSSSATTPPALPARPSTLTAGNANPSRFTTPTNLASTTTAVTPYSSYNRPGYGGYSSYGGAYSSPYSRFGGYGSGMYGGMSSFGGYPSGFGAFPPPGGDPNDPHSLARGMESSTAATFQMIESIVGAFGGFAQMLESTYMATHSSFFAMVQVAEQFGNLRSTLGSILGIFTMMRWARVAFAKVTGRPMPAAVGELTAENFAAFDGRGGRHRGAARPSKKPFLFFVFAIFGLPYLMTKLIRTLAKKEEERKGILAGEGGDVGEMVLAGQMDPAKLEFCRVLFDFTPELNNGAELEVKKGDLVAVLSKADPMGNPSQWWRCRARDSRVGYLPSPYLEVIARKDGATTAKQITSGETGSRAQTMTSEVAGEMIKDTKPSDISIESFQKSQFYS